MHVIDTIGRVHFVTVRFGLKMASLYLKIRIVSVDSDIIKTLEVRFMYIEHLMLLWYYRV